MNCIPALTTVAVLSLAACETMNTPISSGDFDPLRPPGSHLTSASTVTPGFTAGQFVRAAMDNTAFFKVRPKGDADADKLLNRDTSMKVVSISGSYLKVELDSGEVGFVPSVMVEDPNAAPSVVTPMPGEFQVYPPMPSGLGEPLPIIDPASMPPEGSIPAVIDPDAPSVIDPVPSATTPTEPFTAPVPPIEPNVEAVPLPPNGEELEAEKSPTESQ